MAERKWCAIDAEGDVGNRGLLGVAFYSDQDADYLTDHTAIKTLLQQRAEEGYTFLCHNASYDLPVIFWQLNIPIKAVYFNGRFNRGEWKFRRNKATCQLWDTLALSGGLSLAKLGDALSLPKYETPQRFLGREPDRWRWRCERHNRGECEHCYAVRDAEIAYRFMTDLSETLAVWGVAPHRRISGLAMNVWKVLDKPQPITLNAARPERGITLGEQTLCPLTPSTSWKVKQLGRKAYHGGRVETFKLGHVGALYTADVCSMYPSIMATTPYPDPAGMSYISRPAAECVPIDKEGVAECDISIPPMYIPPLPVTVRGQIKYPIGRIRGYWTLAEIRYAVSLGCSVNRWYSVAFSTGTLSPFAAFVDTLWRMRQEYERVGDPRALFAKLLMNNLYGRVGMGDRLERKDIYPAEPNKNLKKQPKSTWYTEGGKLYLTYEREQPSQNNWTNVLWAAQTTAYARMRLHHYLSLQGASVVYCDTDSVFSTHPIVGLGEGLGSLRDEHFYSDSIIAAPKLYALQTVAGDWEAKAKGVPKAMALRFLREGIATYEQPIKPSSQGIRHISAGQWVQVTKERRNVPARRHPTDPAALFSDYGWSDTVPEVVGPLP